MPHLSPPTLCARSRGKRTPGKFMMRLRVPNGELTAKQLRYIGSVSGNKYCLV